MTVWEIDPLRDPRWNSFLDRHPRSTVFHTQGWIESLRRTYGYEPFAVTTAAPGEDLQNGVPFCRVRSWLTGRRTISLPFSDHCQPLVDTSEELECLLSSLKNNPNAGRSRYLEIRPVTLPDDSPAGLDKASSFCLHSLDLRPKLEDLFQGFHRNCVQRKIRRAQREALSYEEGTSETLLKRFYYLMILTRQRHQLLPQPLAWFRNLIACMGDVLKIRLASKNGHPVASILTLRYKESLVYKYGCSDKRFGNLGGMQFLLWKAVQEAKSLGLSEFDLGRSDWDNRGLITFKDRWGASRTGLAYWRCTGGSVRRATSGRVVRLAGRIFRHMPGNFLPLAGSLMYRHYA